MIYNIIQQKECSKIKFFTFIPAEMVEQTIRIMFYLELNCIYCTMYKHYWPSSALQPSRCAIGETYSLKLIPYDTLRSFLSHYYLLPEISHKSTEKKISSPSFKLGSYGLVNQYTRSGRLHLINYSIGFNNSYVGLGNSEILPSKHLQSVHAPFRR